RLADSVDSDDHHYIRSNIKWHTRLRSDAVSFRLAQYFQQLVFDGCPQGVKIVDLLASYAASHRFQNLLRRRYPDVRRDQGLFQFIEQVLINLLQTLENSIETFGECLPRS